LFRTLVWKTCEGNDFLTTNFWPDLSYGLLRQNPKRKSKSVRRLLLFFVYKIKKFDFLNRCKGWPKIRIDSLVSRNNDIMSFYHKLEKKLKFVKPFLRNCQKFKFFRKWGLGAIVTDGLTPKLHQAKTSTSFTIIRKKFKNPL